MKKSNWCAAACAAVALYGGAARAEYGVVDLGAANTPGGINAAGQVALTSVPANMPKQAMLYSGGSFLDLGTLGGANSSGIAINAGGLVVGRSNTTSGVLHAYLWTPGGTGGVASNPQMTDLNPTGGVSEADAINSAWQIVGYVTLSQPGGMTKDVAVMFSSGGYHPLPLPVGGFDSSYAYGINDSGKVVGAAYTAASGLAHGFFYNGTSSVEIGDLGGANASPAAINNNNWIVGYSTTAGGYDHAFLYANGAMTDLGTLGGHYSYANGVNNKNQIVGGAFTDTLDSIYHAFISDSTQMTDLNALITSRAAGWTLSEADAINDNGTIIGNGTLSGQKHAFLLEPLLPGDANADGRVDFTDLLTLAQHYGQGGGWEQGDFNSDGAVGFDDLLALAQDYGRNIGFSSPALTAVPEPGASVMIVAGLLCAIRRRRGKRTGIWTNRGVIATAPNRGER